MKIQVKSQVGKYQQTGFTLAELLVSIGIIVLFTAFLLPSFNNFGRKNDLHQTSQLIQSKIFEAKGFALAPRASGGTPIIEYAFVAPASTLFTSGCSGSTQYAIVEITQAVPNPSTRRDVVCEALPSGLSFVNSATEVRFSVLAQGAVTPQGPPPVPITFTIRQSRLTQENCRNIIVTRATGQVTVSASLTC